MSWRVLCGLDAVADPGAVAGVVRRGGDDVAVVVVRRGHHIWGYVDACPHLGVQLAWGSGHYLTYDKSYILCATHGALFTIDQGFCVQGPCKGKSLHRYPVMLSQGQILAEGD